MAQADRVSVDAVEVVAGNRACPLLLTCEHASERFPEPWRWPEPDLWLQGTHWAFDLGAADLTRELAAELGATAVLSRFSRLLADPNRDPASADLFLLRAEGRGVALNQAIDAAERERRLARLWRPYHQAIERLLAESDAEIVLAIHSFTPVFEGRPRAVELGVLFDEEEALAERLRAALARAGFRVHMNEPYSGRAGLIYCAKRHAVAHGRRAVELEVRQDLAVQPGVRARLVAALGALGAELLHERG